MCVLGFRLSDSVDPTDAAVGRLSVRRPTRSLKDRMRQGYSPVGPRPEGAWFMSSPPGRPAIASVPTKKQKVETKTFLEPAAPPGV